jgi:amidase
MSIDELCFAPASTQREMLERRELSAEELLELHLQCIREVNPAVNAIVTLDEEGALASARAADAALAKGSMLGPLHGLPLGIKDLFDTRGLRTTYASPIYAEHVPTRDHLIVERERAAGAVIVGKTNTPEFGAGAQTFNPVFGTTLNPYDLTRTCGGSSGGSAVALACGMTSLADGSDFGGSLRAPAAWCNVVGLRPSPGRVPSYPTKMGWSTLSVHGPMARTVGDLALFMQAIAGPDPRSPISIEQSPSLFAAPLERDFAGVRIAWSQDLGYLPVDDEVRAMCEAHRRVFTEIGCNVQAAHPDFRGASDIFKTLRAAKFAVDRRDELAAHRNLIKQTIIDNAEAGFALTGMAATEAEEQRTTLWHHVREFMGDYEFMVWPVNPVPPFPAAQETLMEVGGVKMATYVDWGALRHVVSVVGLPSISVPVGLTEDGLPIGLQITGRHNQDFAVLQLAAAFERETQYWRQRPPVTLRT